MKILINTPDLSLPGGVANHYKGLRPFWRFKVDYNFIGRRKNIPSLFILPYDFIKFLFICIFRNYDLIVLNPSLGKTALKRDAFFLKIATLTKNKTIIFWHGWSPEMVGRFNKNSAWIKHSYKHALMHLVLSQEFKSDLIKWEIDAPINITTTKVDDRLIENFNVENKQIDDFTILFLTRVEVYKGIFIVLEACKHLLKQDIGIKLVIAGDGSQLGAAIEFARKNHLSNVHFLGDVKGEELIRVFESSNIYILPTYHEGMPTSVLEAMAFGLPVITRPVGGLNDFFENGKMGFLIESLDPKDYSKKISYLFNNENVMREMSLYNYRYARTHFLGSQVARKLEEIFCDV